MISQIHVTGQSSSSEARNMFPRTAAKCAQTKRSLPKNSVCVSMPKGVSTQALSHVIEPLSLFSRCRRIVHSHLHFAGLVAATPVLRPPPSTRLPSNHSRPLNCLARIGLFGGQQTRKKLVVDWGQDAGGNRQQQMACGLLILLMTIQCPQHCERNFPLVPRE